PPVVFQTLQLPPSSGNPTPGLSDAANVTGTIAAILFLYQATRLVDEAVQVRFGPCPGPIRYTEAFARLQESFARNPLRRRRIGRPQSATTSSPRAILSNLCQAPFPVA